MKKMEELKRKIVVLFEIRYRLHEEEFVVVVELLEKESFYYLMKEESKK